MKYKKILICTLLFLIFITLYKIALTESGAERYRSTFIEKRDVKGNIVMKNNVFFNAGNSGIFSTISVVRPANVPLTPFKSPFKINYEIPEFKGIPNFLLYKTEFLSPVVDQGACGSCWAFSIANTLSDRISASTGGEFKKELSAQQILQCFDPKTGCLGNSPEDALEWLEKSRYKVSINSIYPYKQSTKSNISKVCPRSSGGIIVKKGSVRSIAKWIEENEPNKITMKENIENMKLELVNNGPFFAAMTVYEDFYKYNGKGVYEHDKNSDVAGGHAIEVIGYCEPDVDRRKGLLNSEKGYWICRNSWGSNWPVDNNNNGFFIIKMGSNESGIESRCAVADAEIRARDPKKKKFMRYQSYNNFISQLPPDKKNSYIDVY